MAAGRLEDEDMATCVSVTMGVLGLLLAIFGISSLGLGLTAGWFYIFHENAGYAYIPLWGGCVYMLTGVLGTAIGCCCRNKSSGKLRCWSITFAVLCVLCALIGLAQVVFEAWWSSRVTIEDDFTEYNTLLAIHLRRLHNACSVFGGFTALWGIIGTIVGCIMGC